MKQIIDSAKAALLVGAASCLLYGCSSMQPKITKGYNSLNIGVTQDADERTRAWTNVGIASGPIGLGYSGMNQMTNGDPETYSGCHNILLGTPDVSLCDSGKTNSKGAIDNKIGVRSEAPVKALGLYGHANLLADADAAAARIFAGKDIGDGYSAELFYEIEKEFKKGKPSHYLEAEFKKAFGDNFKGFIRAEIPDFAPRDGTYLLGVLLEF